MKKIKINVMPNEWRGINNYLAALIEGTILEENALVKAVLFEFWETKMRKYNPSYPPKSITLSYAQAIALLSCQIISEHHKLEQQILPFLKTK